MVNNLQNMKTSFDIKIFIQTFFIIGFACGEARNSFQTTKYSVLTCMTSWTEFWKYLGDVLDRFTFWTQ